MSMCSWVAVTMVLRHNSLGWHLSVTPNCAWNRRSSYYRQERWLQIQEVWVYGINSFDFLNRCCTYFSCCIYITPFLVWFFRMDCWWSQLILVPLLRSDEAFASMVLALLHAFYFKQVLLERHDLLQKAYKSGSSAVLKAETYSERPFILTSFIYAV